MEVRINKEIKEIREKIYFGLTMRQIICIILAAIIDVVLYFVLRNHVNSELLSWIMIAVSVPLALMAFFNYNGLTAEQFIIVWIKSEFGAKTLKVVNSNLYIDLLKTREKENKK